MPVTLKYNVCSQHYSTPRNSACRLHLSVVVLVVQLLVIDEGGDRTATEKPAVKYQYLKQFS